MKPCIDRFIHAAENKAFDKTQIEFAPDTAVLLPLLDNFCNKIVVHFGHDPDLVFHHPVLPARFGKIDNGHIRVALEFRQVAIDEITEFRNRCVGMIHRLLEPVEHLPGFIGEYLDQNIVFVLEIEINGSIGNPRSFGYL